MSEWWKDLYTVLKEADVRQVGYVPDAGHSKLINACIDDPDIDATVLTTEEEGIAQKLIEAGFDWRFAGCSMCLGMNPDQLAPGERCASTSNRNFEGRQGRGGRTHLLSPAMAAAAAITIGATATPPMNR